MKQVRLLPEDIPHVQKIYDVVITGLDVLPRYILDNERFGLMLVQALLNIVCEITKRAGASSDVLIDALEQIWNRKFNNNSTLN